MIRLVITSTSNSKNTKPLIYCFEHCPILIGDLSAKQVDIKLSDPALENTQIRVSCEKNRDKNYFFISYMTNATLSNLNKLDLDKKPIKNNELIQIGEISIKFEIEDVPEIIPPPKKLGFFASFFDKNEDEIMGSSNHFPEENEKLKKPSAKPLKKNPKKDFYTSNLSLKKIRFLLTVSSFIIGIFILVLATFIAKAANKRDENEIKAFKAVADVSMALMYAQLKQVQPQNQNWSYSEFIKNNLQAILSPDLNSFANFDTYGQFTNNPYMLRIYSNSNFSHFLVIAQPEQGLLHGVMPKASIVIDSQSMEMHKLTDLKALNRLLVDSNHIEGINSQEISSLIRQGELIPLSKLAKNNDNQGFSLPKALKMIHPGAENRVYNAPRYYQLGETLLKTSLNYINSLEGNSKKAAIPQEFASFIKLPNIVLYSSDGIEYGLEARKNLISKVPQAGFLLAYLQLNSEGQIVSTHLLMDETSQEIALNESIKIQSLPISLNEDFHENPVIVENSTTVDVSNLLFKKLSLIAQEWHEAVAIATNPMIELLKKQSLTEQLNFFQSYKKLEQKYFDTLHDQQNILSQKFEDLINESSAISAAKFMKFINATHLNVSFQQYLKLIGMNNSKNHINESQIQMLLNKVKGAQSWHELEYIVIQANQILQFSVIPDEGRLVAWQGIVTVAVQKKLDELLFLSDSPRQINDFVPGYFQSIMNILRAAWMSDSDLYDFYITEFEFRMHPS